MKNSIKDVLVIRIDRKPISCFLLEDNTFLIDKEINTFFKSNSDAKITQIDNIDGYLIDDVIDNLKPRILKQFAKVGLLLKLENGGDKEGTSISYGIGNHIHAENRELSEFDRMILKAINYNPRKEKS